MYTAMLTLQCIVLLRKSYNLFIFFFSSRRRHTRYWRDWSSDVCSSDLLVTRDKKQAFEMSNYIRDKGGIPVELPLITIEEQEANIASLSKYSAILFNSPNGVNAFFRHIKDIRSLSKIKIGVVGEKTKEEIGRASCRER